MPEKSENGANLRKVSSGMFSVLYIGSRYDVTHTAPAHVLHIFLHRDYDRNRDERTFAVFAGVLARPEKS